MIKFTEEERRLVCSFQERLDTDNCMKLENGLFERITKSKGKAMVFDLGQVDYISSMFLGICMRVAKEAGFANFSLINVQPNVKKVFKISGLETQITIE